MTIKRIHGGKRISRVVVHNGIAYLAGILALQKRGESVAEQTRDILALIDRLLAEAGTDKTRLLTANIWLADIRKAEEMNRYGMIGFRTAAPRPARPSRANRPWPATT